MHFKNAGRKYVRIKSCKSSHFSRRGCVAAHARRAELAPVMVSRCIHFDTSTRIVGQRPPFEDSCFLPLCSACVWNKISITLLLDFSMKVLSTRRSSLAALAPDASERYVPAAIWGKACIPLKCFAPQERLASTLNQLSRRSCLSLGFKGHCDLSM